MDKLYDVMQNPSGMDSWGNYMGERPSQELYVVLGRNRESSLVANSNWDCAIKMFDEAKLEYDITSFGHWACGWVEYLSVDINIPEAYKLAEEIEASLSAYPILNDEDHSEREYEDGLKTIENCIDSWFEIGELLSNESSFFSEMYSHLTDNGYCHNEDSSPSDEEMRDAQWNVYVKDRLIEIARGLDVGETIEEEAWEIKRIGEYDATAWMNDEENPRTINLFKDHPNQLKLKIESN